jgi:hypothetical protein
MDRSRVRGPYARFCERDEVSYGLLTSPYSIWETRSFLDAEVRRVRGRRAFFFYESGPS